MIEDPPQTPGRPAAERVCASPRLVPAPFPMVGKRKGGTRPPFEANGVTHPVSG